MKRPTAISLLAAFLALLAGVGVLVRLFQESSIDPLEQAAYVAHSACDSVHEALSKFEEPVANTKHDRSDHLTVVTRCPLPESYRGLEVSRSNCRVDLLALGVLQPSCHSVNALFVQVADSGVQLHPIPATSTSTNSSVDTDHGRGRSYIVPDEILPTTNPSLDALSFELRSSRDCIGADSKMRWTVTMACDITVTQPQGSTSVRFISNNTSPKVYSRSLLRGMDAVLRRRLAAANLMSGPYLQSVGQASALVVWRMSAADTGVVYVGTSATSLNLKFSSATATTDPVVSITGLKANTLYYYSIGTPTATIASGNTYKFRTLITLGTTVNGFRALMLGDPGTGDINQMNAYTAAKNYMAKTSQAALWFLLGDNAYNAGTDTEYSNNVFSVYKNDFPSVPMYSILGNHDSSSSIQNGVEVGPYFTRFVTPRNGEAGGVPSGFGSYFSLDYGNVHIVCLDSYLNNNSPTGTMATWLKQDLAALKSTTSWLIALYHHAPYSMGTVSSDTDAAMKSMRQNILPILEAGGVDLVIGGHSHDYERSYFINGHYGKSSTYNSATMLVSSAAGTAADPFQKPLGITANKGQISVVTGSAGKADAAMGLMHPANVPLGNLGLNGINTFGVFFVDITGNNLVGTFVDSTGAVQDQFTIEKTSNVIAPPSSTPSASPSFGYTVSASPSIVSSPSPAVSTASQTVSSTPTRAAVSVSSVQPSSGQSTVVTSASSTSSPSTNAVASSTSSTTTTTSPSPTACESANTGLVVRSSTTSSLSAGAYIGIMVGVTSGIAAVVIAVVYWRYVHGSKRKSKSKQRSSRRKQLDSNGDSHDGDDEDDDGGSEFSTPKRHSQHGHVIDGNKYHASPLPHTTTPQQYDDMNMFASPTAVYDEHQMSPTNVTPFQPSHPSYGHQPGVMDGNPQYLYSPDPNAVLNGQVTGGWPSPQLPSDSQPPWFNGSQAQTQSFAPYNTTPSPNKPKRFILSSASKKRKFRFRMKKSTKGATSSSAADISGVYV